MLVMVMVMLVMVMLDTRGTQCWSYRMWKKYYKRYLKNRKLNNWKTATPTTTTTEITSALTASSPLLTNSLGLTSDHQLMKDIMDLLGETPEEDQEILTKIKLATSSMWTQEILETEMDGTFPASSKSDSGACAWTSGQLTLDNDGWYNSAHSPFRYNTTS